MSQQRVIIVGAGLFGSIMGRWLERANFPVVYIDDLRPGAGSPASAGLIKPSWLQGFGDAGKIGLTVLDDLFGLGTIRFKVLGVPVDIHHVDPARVLVLVRGQDRNLLRGTVTKVGDGYVEWAHHEFAPTMRLDGTVVVSTGAWANELIANLPRMQRLMGTAFFYKGQIDEPILDVWAPYKQVKVFSRPGNLIWAGDSTGLLPSSYTHTRKEESRRRVEKYLFNADIIPILSHEITGSRPYIPAMREGLFERVHQHTFVATGGGKMGTVLAGYHATRLLEELTR